MTLVFDGRHPWCHILRMHIVGKAYQRHILRNPQALLLDGRKGSKSDDIVEGQDGIGRILLLQHAFGGFKRPVIVNLLAHHEIPVNRNPVLAQRLQITMLTTPHHVQVVRTADKGYPPAACIYQVLRGLLRGYIAISHHTRELIRQTGSSEEHQGNTHL